MAAKGNPELISSHGHNKVTAICGILFSDKDLRTRWTVSLHQKNRRDALRKVGEAEIWPHPGPHRDKDDPHNWEGVQKYRAPTWGVSGLSLTSGTTPLGAGTRKTRSQTFWCWKSMGIKTRRITETEEIEKLLLKSL